MASAGCRRHPEASGRASDMGHTAEIDARPCPYACSRCDETCPCTCRMVTLREFADGSPSFEAEVCAHDLKGASQRTWIATLRSSYNDLMLWWSDRKYGEAVRASDPSDDWSDLGYWDGR